MKYGIIVVDPPWQCHDQGGFKIRRIVNANYPTMTIAEIASLPIGDLADDISLCFLWTVDKFLYDSKAILEGWGFTYHFTGSWHKSKGLNFYGFTRNVEHFLIGYKGSLGHHYPNRPTVRTCISGKYRGHSVKPDEFYDNLKPLPLNPRVDVFARAPREGWTTIGDEIDGKDIRVAIEDLVALPN
jgi:N6-adenosine-specific RNA methylase IME4